MRNIDLTKADLTAQNLANINLTGSVLRETDMSRVSLSNTTLPSNLAQAILVGVDFKTQDLSLSTGSTNGLRQIEHSRCFSTFSSTYINGWLILHRTYIDSIKINEQHRDTGRYIDNTKERKGRRTGSYGIDLRPIFANFANEGLTEGFAAAEMIFVEDSSNVDS